MPYFFYSYRGKKKALHGPYVYLWAAVMARDKFYKQDGGSIFKKEL